MSEITKAKSKSKRFYSKKPGAHRRFTLNVNLKGFLCSCNNREKDCVRESYNILNEFADRLYPAPVEDTADDNEEDITEALSKEVSSLKSDASTERRFQVVDSGAKNLLFIKTTLDNPLELAQAVVKEIHESKVQKTRFLIRLVPIETTCKAYLEDVEKAFEALADKYFKDEPKTFSVVYNHRNNNNLSRDEVVKMIAEKVMKMRNDHKVDLTAPQTSIIVEVIKGFVFLSVIPEYVKYKKYNLLAAVEQEKDNENKTLE